MSQSRDGTGVRYDGRDAGGTGPDRSALSGSAAELPLLDDEDVLVDAKPTWWAWAGHLALAGVAGLVGLLATVGDATVGVSLLAITLAVVGYVWLRRNSIRYLITDRRVVVITGLTARRTNETWMEDVRGLQTSATSFGRQRGYGTITVSHAVLSGRLGRLQGLRLPGVPDYEHVAHTIRRRQSERKSVEY